MCKLLVHVRDGKMVATERGPLPDSRYDRICLRGLTHVQRVYHPDRLKYPMKRVGERGEGKWQRISWDEAIDTIASKFTEIKDQYGSRSVAFLAQSGYSGLLNGYLGAIFRFANLFEGVWGTGALDSAMPLGMLQVLGGPDHGQGNEAADLSNARLILLWGSNITESNLQNWHFVADALDNGGKMIVIDPRYTVAASKADLWVPLRPGSDAALALSMMNVMIEESLYDADFVINHTVGPFLVRDDSKIFLREKDVKADGSDKYMVWDSGANAAVPFDTSSSASLTGSYLVSGITCKTAFQLLWDSSKQYVPEKAYEVTDVKPETIRLIAREYATRKPASIYWGFGIDRWYHGQLTGRALATLAGLTGNIGKPGATAWGGFGGATAVSSPLNTGPWFAPTKSRAIQGNNLQVMDVIQTGDPFPIKAAYFSSSNYIDTFPNQNKIVNELFPKLDFIVVADFSMTDTAEQADIVLPVTTWFENDDLVATMHPHVLLQQRAIDPLYECKSDLAIFSLLASRVGFGEYFNQQPEDYIKLMLDSQKLRDMGVTYETLKRDGAFRAFPAPIIPFTDGKFNTPSGRIEFYNEALEPKLPVFLPPVEAWPDSDLAKKYPLVCLQARTKFRVHTQYFNIQWLREVDPFPFVEMNPADAEQRDLADGDIVDVFNDRGSVRLKTKLNDAMRPGTVNISKGWSKKQLMAGSLQSLIFDYKNPENLNCAFFDTLVEVKKV
jgi:anaerobic dimethyl sulfoxide reductase subunit A